MVHFVQSIIWCSFICHSLCNLRKFRSTVRLHIVCNISFPLKESTMGREKGWSSGNRSKDRRRSDPIGPERFWRLCLILAWDWPLVGLETLEKKNLLASERSSLLLPFTPALAGPFSWGLNIRTLLAPVSNSSRLIGGVGSAIWHGTDWQTITGRLYCQQTPTSARRLCYSLHNGSTTHNSGHNPIR